MDYVYTWTLEASGDVEIDVRIRATSAARAQREVRDVVGRRVGGDWQLRGVSRASRAPVVARGRESRTPGPEAPAAARCIPLLPGPVPLLQPSAFL